MEGLKGRNMSNIFQNQLKWEDMYFYQKADVLYQMTVIFCKRFLPPYGDRTVDQMVQAARSGKQNIVEGSADGVTSMEMEIKMLNVARGSIKELREDYRDYLKVHSLKIWEAQHERYDRMLRFCRIHNRVEEYAPLFEKFSAEEFANCAITLCHMVDRMLMTYLEKLEKKFIAEGGIRERMTAARLKRRETQQQEVERLRKELEALKIENEALKKQLGR